MILDVEKEQPNNDIGTPLLSGNGRSQSRINPPATPFSDMNFIDGTENRWETHTLKNRSNFCQVLAVFSRFYCRTFTLGKMK